MKSNQDYPITNYTTYYRTTAQSQQIKKLKTDWTNDEPYYKPAQMGNTQSKLINNRRYIFIKKNFKQDPQTKSKALLSEASQNCKLSERCEEISDKGQIDDLDLFLLENFSKDDPIWKEILPESILNDPNIDLGQLINQNQEYFQFHVANYLNQQLNLAPNPIQDNIGNKLKFKPGLTTTYNQQHQLNDNQNQLNSLGKITNDHYSTQSIAQPFIDCKSNSQVNHDQKNISPQISFRPKNQVFQNYSNPKSSYQNTFLNWMPSGTFIEKKPYHISTSDKIPFSGNSSSKTVYGNFLKNVEQERKYQFHNIPILPKELFLGESTSQRTFRAFESNKVDNLKPIEKYTPISSFASQFRTTNQQDFLDPKAKSNKKSDIIHKLLDKFYKRRNEIKEKIKI